MNTTAKSTASILMLLMLSGCAALPKHDLDISELMRNNPITRVYVMPPIFPAVVKRADPGDYRQMLPENRQASGEILRKAIESALSASLAVESAWVPGPGELEWANKIGADLAIGRVPLGVPSATIPVESVLITGVYAYGTEKDQITIHPFPFLPWTKPRVFGDVRWDHVTDLEVMLVRPSDGKVLFTLRHDERFNTGFEDSSMLEQASNRTAAAIADVFRKAAENYGSR